MVDVDEKIRKLPSTGLPFVSICVHGGFTLRTPHRELYPDMFHPASVHALTVSDLLSRTATPAVVAVAGHRCSDPHRDSRVDLYFIQSGVEHGLLYGLEKKFFEREPHRAEGDGKSRGDDDGVSRALRRGHGLFGDPLVRDLVELSIRLLKL